MNQNMMSIVWIIVMVAVFYFLLIRPQQKQRKERQSMMDSLSVGDEIITIGGFIGTITRIKEDTLWIRLAEKVEVEITKTAVGSLNNKEALKESAK